MSTKPIEAELRWLGSRRFWFVLLALFLLAVGLVAVAGFNKSGKRAPPQEAFLYGQSELTPGRSSSFRLFVRDGDAGEPIAQAKVQLELVDRDGKVAWSGEARSDVDGMALAEALPPLELAEGSYTLKVEVSSTKGESSIERAVEVKRSFKVLVSTDKPLYQPGQVIHIRSLALANSDLRPVAEQPAVIEVLDGKSNKVFKQKLQTSGFGLAAADFTLADQVNLGEYRVKVTVGDTESERVVNVKRYRLPKFKIGLETERGYYGPGDTVEGELDAQYTWGEPVVGGKVELVAADFVDTLKPFATVSGVTEASGRYSFRIPLKDHFVGQARTRGDATVSLEAKVTDAAGHVQKRSLELTVTSEPLRVEVFPESGQVVRGVENELFILTAYPDGRPAQTTVRVAVPQVELQTSEAGIARLTLPAAQSGQASLDIEAVDSAGLRVKVSKPLRVDNQASLLLRTDRALYRVGETAKLSVFSAHGEGRVFVDVVKGRQTALTQVVDVKQGRGELALDLPDDLFGTLELHAYRVMPDGQLVGDARIIQVARADDIKIQAQLDREVYRPAEKALLRLAVSRSDGEPVPAALSLSGVDEAVFALQEARPGLERVYFMLQEELLKPRYQLAARPPLSARQAFEQQGSLTPQQEEASLALFSTAEGGAVPTRDISETFQQRQVRYGREFREYKKDVRLLVALLPFFGFGLIALCVFAYAGLRLFRRRPAKEVSEEGRRQLKSAARGVVVWWVVGYYLPVAVLLAFAFFAEAFQHSRLDGLLVAIALGLTVLFCFWRLIRRVRAFRRHPAAAQLPLLRKLLVMLVMAYVLVGVAVVAALTAVEIRPRALDDDLAALLLLGIAVLAVFMTGAISAAARAAIEPTSTLRYLALLVLRPVIVGLPVLLLVAVALPGRMSAPMLEGQALAPPMAVADMADETAVAQGRAFAGMEKDAAPEAKKVTDSSRGGKALKKPTRVRRYFPETLLWQPELVTDEKGEASLEIPLADSITTWRLAMSAVSRLGELGATSLGLRVFQDFFVDIDFPVALTQNDKVSVPIAVYNYLDTPQTVRLEVQPAAWFRLEGPSSRSLALAAKEITSVPLVLVAKKPGTHALLVKAHGSEMADAVERTVRVEPDGKAVDQVANGRLEGTITQTVEVPANAVAGASRILVRLYPGAFSQVVGGMESLLRLPGG